MLKAVDESTFGVQDSAAPLAKMTEPLSRLEDYEEFRAGLDNFRNRKWQADRWVTFRLRFGVYAQKQDGMHMVRVKVPGGRMPLAWLRAAAKAMRDHCGGGVRITTRQGLQFYFVALDSLPGLLKSLNGAGMTTREASGNTMRNVTACPLAGICARQRVDAGAVAQRLATTWLRHPLVQHMPRKFKTAVSGCELDCGAASFDDLGLIATVKDGQNGFRVVAGGGLGSAPRAAVEVLDFIVEEDLPALQEAMAHLHHRYSNRKRKMSARLKFLVKKRGEEAFVKLFKDAFERARRLPQRRWEPLRWRDPADGQPPPLRRAKITQHDGNTAVIIRPANATLTSDQLDALADAAESAGAAEYRLTREQSIVAVGLPTEKADAFTESVLALGLDAGGKPHGLGDMVVCPGASTCPIGINNAGALAEELLADADAFAGLPETRMRISGCHNACGRHHLGDIGLHGVAKKVGGRNAPHYRLHLGGASGAIAMDGPDIPARRVKEALKILLGAYAESRGEGESVGGWAKRLGEQGIRKLLAPVTEGQGGEEAPSLRFDLGSDKPFFPPVSAVGECAASAVVGEYLADLADVGRLDLERALLIGDREQALAAGRRSLLFTARRLLFVIGVEMADFDDARLFQEVNKQFGDKARLMAALNAALKAESEASGGGGMDAFAKSLADWASAAAAVIEDVLTPLAVMGAAI